MHRFLIRDARDKCKAGRSGPSKYCWSSCGAQCEAALTPVAQFDFATGFLSRDPSGLDCAWRKKMRFLCAATSGEDNLRLHPLVDTGIASMGPHEVGELL